MSYINRNECAFKCFEACANEIDTTQEKDEKDYLEHFVLVWLRSVHI